MTQMNELIKEKAIQVFKNIAANIAEKAKEHIENGRSIEPVVFLCHQGGRIKSYELKLDNDDEKIKSIHCIKTIAKKMNSVCAITVIEAWMVECDENEKLKIMGENLKPSTHPDKKEILNITMEAQGKAWFAVCQINRLNGGAVKVDDIKFEQQNVMHGNLFFLPSTNTSEKEKASVQRKNKMH